MGGSEYCNRDRERGQLLELINGGARLVLVQARSRCGITAYLSKVAQTLSHGESWDGRGAREVLLLSPSSISDSFCNSLLNARIGGSKEIESRLVRKSEARARAAEEGPVIANTLVQVAASLLPHNQIINLVNAIATVPFLKLVFDEITKSRIVAQEQLEDNRQLTFLSKLFRKMNAGVVVIVDRAQEFSERAYGDLRALLLQVPKLSVVLSFSAADESANSSMLSRASHLLNDIDGGESRRKVVRVYYPDETLLSLINRHNDFGRDEGEINLILHRHPCDIWSMMAELRDGTDSERLLTFEGRQVAAVLSAFDAPIPRDVLVRVCARRGLDSSDVKQGLSEIESAGRLRYNAWNDITLESSPLATDVSEALTAKRDIVATFNETECECREEQLKRALQIARDVYPNSLQPASRLLRRCVVGDLISGKAPYSNEELRTAFPVRHQSLLNYHDDFATSNLVLYVASCLVKNDFDEIVSTLGVAGDGEALSESLRLAFGVALNRTRAHEAAEAVLSPLVKRGVRLSTRVLAGTYLLVNYLYQGRRTEAESLFESGKTEYRTSEYYPYFLRNAGSLHQGHSLAQYLETLLGTMDIKDAFCRATIKNNLARCYLSLGRYTEAEALLGEAADAMDRYQYKNQAIVLNNMAILYILTRRYEKATEAADKACQAAVGEMPSNRMQQLFIKITGAVANFFLDQEKAFSILDEMDEEIDGSAVAHTKEVYYSTRALLEVLSKRPTARQYVRQAERYPNVLRPARSMELTARLRHILDGTQARDDEFERLYDPSYLVFWYVSPLSLMGEELGAALDAAERHFL